VDDIAVPVFALRQIVFFVWVLTGQSFLILVGGRPKVPIKCDLISKEINWERKGLRLQAVGWKAARPHFAGPVATRLFVVIGLAGQVGHFNQAQMGHSS
jgi:hypothetical protein